MIGSVNLYGLKVENVSPSNLSSNISINSEINITFNSDLNTGSIPGNIFIYKDTNSIFKEGISLDAPNFELIGGRVSYLNKTLTFRPDTKLLNGTRYIVSIKNNIKDILGNIMLQNFTSSFYTTTNEEVIGCAFLYPESNKNFKEIPEFSWTIGRINLYTFQISKTSTFENLVYEKEVSLNKLTPDVSLSNDTYYARVKSVDSTWSNTIQFYLETVESYPVTKEDELFDSSFLYNFENNELEILEVFPKDNSINIDTKLKNIYIKVKGKLTHENINILENALSGYKYDEEDDSYKDHGDLDTKTTIVYNDTEEVSYVILTIK